MALPTQTSENSAAQATAVENASRNASAGSVKTCSRCGEALRPSRRRRLPDIPLKWVGLKPYRCVGCSRRSYRK